MSCLVMLLEALVSMVLWPRCVSMAMSFIVAPQKRLSMGSATINVQILAPHVLLTHLLTSLTVVQDNDLVCSVCTMGESEPPNEIVICDTCNKGFHQTCHTPKISDQVLLPNIPWHCRNCVPVGSVRKSAKNYKNGARVQMFKLGFPYNMKTLQWDDQHKVNTKNCYCYCGGPGEWNMKMLQCRSCRQWFHEACIQGLETPLLYGDSFYYFTCSVCNNGPEVVKRMPLTWMDITHLTLYNLVMERRKKYYDLDDVILPYLNSIWLALQLPSDIFRCSVRERRTNIYGCLCSDRARFKSGKEVKKRTSLWGLRNRTAPPIPGEEAPRELRSVVPALPPRAPLSKPAPGACIYVYSPQSMRGVQACNRTLQRSRRSWSSTASAESHHVKVRVFRRGVVKDMVEMRGRENGQKKARRKRLQSGRVKNNASHSSKLSNGLGRSKPQVRSVKVPRDPFDSDEEAVSSGTGEGSTFLDAFIPPLRDFHGGNHPFRDEVLFPPPPRPRPRPGRPPKKRTLLVPLKPAKLKLRGSQRRLCFGTADTDSEDCSSMSSTCTTSTGSATSSGTTTSSSSTSSSGTISSTSTTSSTASSRVDCSTQGRGSLRWKETLRSSEAASSEKSRFSVLAKRISFDGKVQYLIDWDNCGSKT
ncbi:serine/arginine repetitive matrix protein 2 isoform X2 [Rhipicephalus sanguineus]|uniref:serine/arginine repetitive matrix protein 2 isoform X2 n=1 Tax=Rhipicephalus sanguineus TaxID=34632 RepID=UPI0020C52425|nr:serine/arginine repetitive matrix protein 2 isoform X2 [Rhipicephalus sanguineus]